LKKLDKLIFTSFIGPFAATFCISMFLFLMQFLWKYIDEFVGKGLEWHVFARLLFFAMADLIPFALPLSVLLSAIMTYGNLSETSELVAIKAAGVSLGRALRPSFMVMLVLSALTFYVSNIIIPRANLEFKTLLWDIREKKPAFNIREGIFYSEIENFSIKISKKENDNQTIRNVLIYEKNPHHAYLSVIRAEWGVMKLTEDKRALKFTLYNGVRYEEMAEHKDYYLSYPHNIFKFKMQEMAFDLSQLDMKQTEKEMYKGHYRFMNVVELKREIDSLVQDVTQKKEQYISFIMPYFSLYGNLEGSLTDSVTYLKQDDLIQNFDSSDRSRLIELAMSSLRNLKSMIEVNRSSQRDLYHETLKYKVEWHKKFTLSSVILVLFFLAAPLGTIIRKGGLGLPMVVSIVLFILYYVVDMVGNKIGREGLVPVWLGSWLATFVLLPVAFWIMRKAAADAPLFESGGFHFFNKFRRKRKRIDEGS
jgi:lipopolysaccharide export system permease protein